MEKSGESLDIQGIESFLQSRTVRPGETVVDLDVFHRVPLLLACVQAQKGGRKGGRGLEGEAK